MKAGFTSVTVHVVSDAGAWVVNFALGAIDRWYLIVLLGVHSMPASCKCMLYILWGEVVYERVSVN